MGVGQVVLGCVLWRWMVCLGAVDCVGVFLCDLVAESGCLLFDVAGLLVALLVCGVGVWVLELFAWGYCGCLRLLLFGCCYCFTGL